MRLSDLLHLGSDYIILGLILSGIVTVGILTGYFVVYKKILKGERTLTIKTVLWWVIFICYLSVVLGVTLLRGGGFWRNRAIQPLFYSYREAWVRWSASAWRNIILNFCMFIPLGIWLPIGIKSFRKCWKVYLAGFVLSLLIELIQLMFHKGIFELDDLFGNTVGAMIGYGFFALGNYLIATISKKKAGKLVKILPLQLPLVMTVIAFAMIFHKYAVQELGNNPYLCIKPIDKSLLHMSGNSSFDKKKTRLPVYKVQVLDKEAALEFGKELFENMGSEMDEGRMDVYEESVFLYSQDERYSLNVQYLGGSYHLTDFNVIFPDEEDEAAEPVTGADELTIRKSLSKKGITIPDGCEFSERENGSYQFSFDMVQTDDGVINGALSCEYYGGQEIGTIANDIVAADLYQECEAVSEQEAYHKLSNGEFNFEQNGALDIRVEDCCIEYVMDSKGFYQPNYRFDCSVNGEKRTIVIPALK